MRCHAILRPRASDRQPNLPARARIVASRPGRTVWNDGFHVKRLLWQTDRGASIRPMLIEVYGSEKPAKPRRALLASILLLAGTCALSAAMTWERSGGSLRAPIRPEGWDISFRVPTRFQPGEPVRTRLGPAYPFFGRAADGRAMVLAVRRLANEDDQTPSELCKAVMRQQRPFARSLVEAVLGDTETISAKSLGPLPGAEIVDPSQATVVRAAVHYNGRGYAVSLSVEAWPIDSRLYRLFEATCASVEPEPY